MFKADDFIYYARMLGFREESKDLLTEIKNKMKTIVTLTQAEYDALETKAPSVIYIIKEEETV